MDALLSPRSVALVGISDSPANMCRQIYEGMSQFGSGLATYFVNSRRDEILGRKCYPSLAALPEAPDVAVIAIPSESVMGALADGAQKGIRSAIVLTSGFAEGRSSRGLELQQQLAEFAKRTGMRICGPNCVGLVNFADSRAVFAAAGTAAFKANIAPGGLSIASQSGGLLISLLSYVAESVGGRLGIRYAVSSGNEADLNSLDYLEHFLADEGTRIVGLMLEGVRDGRRLKQLARQALRIGKPIVVLKIGRTPKGRTATVAHTGSMAGEYEVLKKVLADEGVVFADSIVDFVEIAALLQHAGKVAYRGTGVCAVALSGGTAGLAADLGSEKGLTFLAYSEAVAAGLRGHLPAFGSVDNPLDLTGAALGTDSTPIFEKIANASPDAMVLVVPLKAAEKDNNPGIRALIDQFARFCSRSGAFGIVVATVFGSLGRHWSEYSRATGLPFSQDIEKALLALSELLRFCAARARLGSPPADERASEADRIAPAPLQFPASAKTLGERESKQIFGQAGLPVTKERAAASSAEAVRAAGEIGYPVVLKLDAPGVAHKSEAEGVMLDLRTAQEVAKAYERIVASAGKHGIVPAGVLVQEMVAAGVEVYVGTKHDSDFGPVIVFGTGGVLVEIVRDYAFKLAPLESKQEALELIARTRASELLAGFRGRAAADVDALAELLLKVSELAHANRDAIKAIDLNPVFVLDKGSGVRIADSLIDLF